MNKKAKLNQLNHALDEWSSLLHLINKEIKQLGLNEDFIGSLRLLQRDIENTWEELFSEGV